MDKIQQLMNERIVSFFASEKPKEMIDKKIEELFHNATSDVFSSYGDFGKTVKEAIKAMLPGSIDDVADLPVYHKVLGTMIRARANAVFPEHAQPLVEQVISDLLQTPPKSMDLADICRAFFKGKDAYSETEPRIEIDNDNDIDGYYRVRFFDERTDGIAEMEIAVSRVGEIYSLKHARRGTEAIPGPFYGYEKLIFQLYACRTIITNPDDCDPDDIWWSEFSDER